MLAATFKFLANPLSYRNLVVPAEIAKGYKQVLDVWLTPSKWNPGDFANMLLNGVIAPNPYSRLLMKMIYKTEIPGLSKLWFGPDYSAFKQYTDKSGHRTDFNTAVLETGEDVPRLYHNAFDITAGTVQLFSNRGDYPRITFESLCACSALPYILSPVEINGTTYIEGATVDTLSFKDLIENHPQLDEIWVSKIIARPQMHDHRNLLQALQNLVMMFACTTGDDNIELFMYKLQAHNERRKAVGKRPVRLYILPHDPFTNFDWTESNFDNTVEAACATSARVIADYKEASSAGREDDLSVQQVLA
jgi:hypothetical protein